MARPDGAALIVRCVGASSDDDTLTLLDIASSRVTKLAARSIRSFSIAWSPDGLSLAYFKLGDCPMPAPVCQTRGIMSDVGTGAEREILSSDYHLGTQLTWTSTGLRMFQPECAEAGCFPPEQVGTFLWDGARFNKTSDMRLIASDGARFSLYERVRSLSDTSAVRNVILRDGRTERNLTAVGPREYALDLLDGGHALSWRPDDVGGELDGTLREYDPQGVVVWSRDAKIYPPWTTRIGETLVSGILEGAPGMAAYVYDLRRGIRFIVPLETTTFVAVKR
jgi:hypothetical protein